MSIGNIVDNQYGKEIVKVVDMQKEMIAKAFSVAEQARAKHEIERQIAKHIKDAFDVLYQ